MAAAKIAKKIGKIHKTLLEDMVSALAQTALPGENEGFDAKAAEDAARFTIETGLHRKPGTAALALDSFTDTQGRLMMRVALNNDDMPFLVDSVSSAVAACGIAVKRIIHPVLSVVRADALTLLEISRKRLDGQARESFIYLETERVDARARRKLENILSAVLADVRGAVTDWRDMLTAFSADADSLRDSEGTALIRWFLDNNMTILAHERISSDGARSDRLGLSRVTDAPVLAEDSVALAIKWFEDGGIAPLVLKSNRVSTVHRSVQLDLIVIPVKTGGPIKGLAVTAGLWTSAALATTPEEIPLLRTHLASLMKRFGFDPSGHAGKAMAHALTALPHDLLVALKLDDLGRVTLSAMSLTDRPRPKLIALRSPLGRKLYIFVWLPSDDVSAGIRKQIQTMLMDGTGGSLLG